MTVYDTPEKRIKRQMELDEPEINRLKIKGQMGMIIAQAKHNIDTDYNSSDNGEPPQGA